VPSNIFLLDLEHLSEMINSRKFRISKEFGKRLKKLRKDRNMSLRQLAAESGIEHAQIYRIESGKVDLKLSTIVMLAEALKVPAADLVP